MHSNFNSIQTLPVLSLRDKSKLIRETLIVRLFVVALCVTSAMLLSVTISITPMKCNPVNGHQRNSAQQQQQQQQVANGRRALRSGSAPNKLIVFQQRHKRNHRQESQQMKPAATSNSYNNMRTESTASQMQFKRPFDIQTLSGGDQASLKRMRSGPLMGAASEPSLSRNIANGRQHSPSSLATNSTNNQPIMNSSDINNNGLLASSPSNDLNNNTIYTTDVVEPRRNINSVNGTIDLSQYEQSDVDRLYGDALLVYLKNFNE